MTWVMAAPTAKRLFPSQLSGQTWNHRVAKRNSSSELATSPIREAWPVVGRAAVPSKLATMPQHSLSDEMRIRHTLDASPRGEESREWPPWRVHGVRHAPL